MPNTILIKRSSTASAAPTAGQLTAGELAINTADGRLFTKTAAGAIVNLPVSSINAQAITPSGVQTTSLGTVSAPAVSFSTDTNTGMYSPAADTVALVTNGTQAVRVDSAGRVNIGTATSWTSKLLVDNGSMPGTAQTETFQVLDSSSTGDYINLGRFNVNRSGARGSFSLSNSASGAWENNVLQFFVHGTTYPHGYYGGNASDAGCAIITTQGSNITKLQIGNYGNAPLEFFTNNTRRLSVLADGNMRWDTDQSIDFTDCGGLVFNNTADIGNGIIGELAAIRLVTGNTAEEGRLSFSTTSSTGPSEKVRIDEAGNLLCVNATGSTVGFKAPTTLTSHTYTLPATTGAASQVLTTNGSGVLSWTTAAPAADPTFTGAISSAAGTALLPAYTFTGDTNTGIWSPGSDNIAVSTVGVERFRITSAGRTLIHAGGEQYGLGVRYSTAGGYVYFGATNATATPDAAISAAGGGTIATFANNGDVGIGTAPAYRLHVSDSAFETLNLQGTGTTSGIRFTNSGGTVGNIYYDNGPNMIFYVNAAEKARITAAGAFQLSGSTSGFVAFQSPAAPTSHTYTLPSVTGTAGQVLTTNGSGVLSWTAPTVRATITATAGQTSFTISGGYTVGGIDVYLNGIKQVNGDDFTATNGTSITLTQAADAGDILDYVAYGFAVTTGALVKSGDTMTGNLTMTAGTTFTMSGYTETTVAIGNSSTAQTLSITNGTQVTCTLTGNCTFTMPAATAGKRFTLLLRTGAGAFTATFTGVKWPANTAPTITATAARMDIITFVSDGTNWYGSIEQNYTP